MTATSVSMIRYTSPCSPTTLQSTPTSASTHATTEVGCRWDSHASQHSRMHSPPSATGQTHAKWSSTQPSPAFSTSIGGATRVGQHYNSDTASLSTTSSSTTQDTTATSVCGST